MTLDLTVWGVVRIYFVAKGVAVYNGQADSTNVIASLI
jgi:hypothetical protein